MSASDYVVSVVFINLSKLYSPKWFNSNIWRKSVAFWHQSVQPLKKLVILKPVGIGRVNI